MPVSSSWVVRASCSRSNFRCRSCHCSSESAKCPCRRTSSARRGELTANATRRSMRGIRALSQRRRPACISTMPCLQKRGRSACEHAWVTLHVGAGTFQALRQDQVEDNRLHAEQVEVSQAVCDAVAADPPLGGRVIAVGTTSVRALECASQQGELQRFRGETDLFILPGYRVSQRRRHAYQFSLAAIVAADAGCRICRQERILRAYRARGAGKVSLLQLR